MVLFWALGLTALIFVFWMFGYPPAGSAESALVQIGIYIALVLLCIHVLVYLLGWRPARAREIPPVDEIDDEAEPEGPPLNRRGQPTDRT